MQGSAYVFRLAYVCGAARRGGALCQSNCSGVFAMVGDGGEFMIYEKYAIIYKVSSAVRGATAQEAALPAVDRAWQMVAYIETAVRTDPSFGGLLVEAIPGQTGGGEAVYTDGAWLCELTGRIQCEATL